MNAITATAAAVAAAFELAEGEAYAGVLLNEDGTPSHHLILLPGDVEDKTYQLAIDWAASIGGELPTRREQSLLFANAKQHFKRDWYWSSEQHASDESYAWDQDFDYGFQFTSLKSAELRARAVRRLTIQ